MKPVLKYPGAKWRLADWIIDHIPPHVGYVEPFFGSGAVFFNKPKSTIETISDLDGAVVQFFKVCREKPDELAYALSLTPWSREEFQQADFRWGDTDDVEAARQFAVRCWQTFGARTSVKTGWRNSSGKTRNCGPDNPAMWKRLPEVVQEVAARLLDAQIDNRPAVDVISNNNGPEVLIYADPPYVKSSRTLNGDQYRFEMTDEQHVELLTVLKRHKGPVLLSGYDCELYRDMLPDWEFDSIGAKVERGAPRTELLWMNPVCAEHHAQMRLSFLGGPQNEWDQEALNV